MSVKRLFDFILATIGLILLSPVLIALGLLIRLTSSGPVLFRQTRVGRFGKEFKINKFRSMIQGAPQLGAAITVGDDFRITALGRFMRKTKLDELPQLWNIFLGEMSFVGPRPEVPLYVKAYSESKRRVLDLVPGVTDPASLALYNESEILATQKNPETFYARVLVPEKVRINLEYANRANMFTDLQVIVMTVLKIFGIRIDPLRFFNIRPINFEYGQKSEG
jgi:lipopolysaccharide/colanic/teichoic acid biosynthesis glycosyltransferase